MMFASAARFLSNEAQRFGLDAPGFRSPPRTLGVQRSLRRTEHGCVVAVLVRDRPFVAVLADMIEGVIVANRLVPPDADVDEQVEALRERFATLNDVERAAADGDFVFCWDFGRYMNHSCAPASRGIGDAFEIAVRDIQRIETWTEGER